MNPKYESISLPEELRGNVKDYRERIYQSPIKTSAGNIHFRSSGKVADNYFGHTRIEDLVNSDTRRVIEVQSDLYQKGNLERELNTGRLPYKSGGDVPVELLRNNGWTEEQISKAIDEEKNSDKLLEKRANEIKPLQQYNDPTAHFRIVREEVKQAAIDGKTKLQFPIGETAMKIEGLGTNDTFKFHTGGSYLDESNYTKLTPDNIKVGKEILQGTGDYETDKWIITDVLGDEKFKAIPKNQSFPNETGYLSKELGYVPTPGNEGYVYKKNTTETFDISGKVDTNNPIYKFYEKDLGRYLKNKYDAKIITDNKGVSWYELNVSKDKAKLPVEAFGVIPFLMQPKKKKKELFITK